MTLETVRREYDKYRSLADKPDEVGGQGTAEGVDFDAFLEKDLQGEHAGMLVM